RRRLARDRASRRPRPAPRGVERAPDRPRGRRLWAAGGRVAMRIAQVAPLAESVPPALYGGTERVVHWLTEGLVARGHDVTLFASGDSRTQARLVPCAPRALRLAKVKDASPWISGLVRDVVQRALDGGFDVVHSHIDHWGFV